MDIFEIYCTGCGGALFEAYAKADSGVANGRLKDEYYCADCAQRHSWKRIDDKRAEAELEAELAEHGLNRFGGSL